MSLVPSFIDESGRDERATVFAIAGVLITQSEWFDLWKPWHEILKEFNLPRYKFSQVAKWERHVRREELHGRLADLLASRHAWHIGACFPLSDFKDSMVATGFARRVKCDLKYWGQPYTMGAMHLTQELIQEARNWLRAPQFRADWGQNIAPVFCDAGVETKEFEAHIFPRLNVDRILNPITVSTVDKYWELQVADFIVGQYRAAAEDYLKTRTWKSTDAMSKLRHHPEITFKHWSFDNFEAFRASTEAELRKSHHGLFTEDNH